MNSVFSYVINSCDVTVHALKKKKISKRKREFGNARNDRQMWAPLVSLSTVSAT